MDGRSQINGCGDRGNGVSVEPSSSSRMNTGEVYKSSSAIDFRWKSTHSNDALKEMRE